MDERGRPGDGRTERGGAEHGAPAAPAPARRAVVVGASAGGPAALTRLLAALDPDLDMAVVVVNHVGSEGRDMLASILGRSSGLPVGTAQERRPVEAKKVHVAPSG